MRAEFSEFSYGFALTYELTFQCWPQISGVPLFPSLLAEAEKGFDVSFAPAGIPLFLQFKLPEYMSTARALYWSDYNRPYFRLAVYPQSKSNQHNLLRRLAQLEPEVYYAAPSFFREPDFGTHFVASSMVSNSAFFRLADLPDITDDSYHHITYLGRRNGFCWHSDDQRYYDTPISGGQWAEMMERRAQNPRKLGPDFFLRLLDRLVGLVRLNSPQPPLPELPQDLREGEESTRVLRDLAFVLATHFGLEMFLLRPKAGAPSE